MKLRYTSLQVDTGVAEEDGRPSCGVGLDGAGGGLRPAQPGGVRGRRPSPTAAPGRRLVYVMTDSAALPLALSDLVADLRRPGAAGGDGHVRAGVRRRPRGGERALGAAGGGGRGRRRRRRRGAGPGRGRHRHAPRVRRAGGGGRRRRRRPRWAAGRSSPCGTPTPTPATRHRGVSHHTTTALELAACRPAWWPCPGATDGHDGLGTWSRSTSPTTSTSASTTSMGRGPARTPGSSATPPPPACWPPLLADRGRACELQLSGESCTRD